MQVREAPASIETGLVGGEFQNQQFVGLASAKQDEGAFHRENQLVAPR
jgi:hypothetical protein